MNATTTIEASSNPVPFIQRALATLISYVFHPIFLVPYMAAFLIFGEPSFYLGASPMEKRFRMLTILINAVLYPLLLVLLAKALGFIKSIQMQDAQDRIIPYIGVTFFYFWAWRVMNNLQDSPRIMVSMLFGVFLAASIGLVLNSFLKVSMHTTGVGGLFTFMILLAFYGTPAMGLPIALAILIAGLVWSARMLISNHTQTELVMGFMIGMLGQLVAAAFFH
jgi:uncharacterized membrane-anchored protein YitT (DUF2179 family)